MKLTWARQHLKLRHFFATARGGIDEKQTIVVCFEHDGVRGWGEIVASELYGQSLEASEAALHEIPPLLGDDPFAIDQILSRLLARFDAQRCAVCGVDSALHDWVARRLGVPVWRLLGLSAPRVNTTFTIGIADVAVVREKVKEALAAGYTTLKVKVGVPGDEQTLAVVRESFDGPILLDANEAWSPHEASMRVVSLMRFRPTVIEQPVARQDWHVMRQLRGLGATIIADESCERPADVLRLAGAVDGVNIKLTKCGGMREALLMIALARMLNMRVMLGCFVSSSLAIAPALAIAGLVDYADLDGHLLLQNDPIGGLESRGSLLTAPSQPGIGVEPGAAESAQVT